MFVSDIWKLYADKKMVIMMLLGMVSGLPFLLVSSTLSLWLKDAGVSLAAIGLFSLVKAPYSFKWLFSPIIDHCKLPFFSRLGRRRGWAIFLQILLIISLVLMSLVSPKLSPTLFVGLVFLVAFMASSQDIVLDAYRIESFEEKDQAGAVAVFVFGYRMGTVMSGAGAIFLASFCSWSAVYQIMSCFVLIGMMTMLWAKEPKGEEESKAKNMKEVVINAVIKPFSDFMHRDKWLTILVFVFCYRMSDAYVAPVIYPFYDDVGFSKMEIASVIKIYGVIATIFGTFVGGAMVKKIGLIRALVICGVLQGVSNLAYMAQYYLGDNTLGLAINISIKNVTSGMGTAAFVAFMSSLCNRKYTATQYALLSSFMGIARDLFSATSGMLVSALNWPLFFVVTSLMAVPGLLILAYLVKTKAVKDN